MKKLFFLSILSSVFFTFSSCEDESLSPLPTKVEGQFVKFNIANKQFDFANINSTTFGGTLVSTSGNIVKYELYVRRDDKAGTTTGDYVLLQTITSFPYDLALTPAQIATALGITVSDLQDGDKYRFLGFSYDANGNKAGFSNLSRSVQIANYVEQGYKFNTQLATVIDPDYNNHQL